jgi:hypothetical protein
MKFILNASLDTLPTNSNLKRWGNALIANANIALTMKLYIISSTNVKSTWMALRLVLWLEAWKVPGSILGTVIN